MKEVDGWFCPDLLSGAGKYLRRAQEDAIRTIGLCAQHRVAIQAGGHVGTWPCFLAETFAHVYTFEPAPENFECLVRNVGRHSDRNVIYPVRGILGNKRGPMDMVLSGKSTGQHRVRAPDGKHIGSVPTYRIDDLALPVVDALFLDVEGYEQHALMGARETLKRCRPIVMAENNDRAQQQGFRPDDLEVFMRSADYTLHERVGEDLIFVPSRYGK
jgi:FkbM family methyltransferase